MTDLMETDPAEQRSFAGFASNDCAGFWVRVWAWLIDSVILCLIALAIAYAAGLNGDIRFGVPFQSDLLGFVIALIFGASFTASAWQASPGKRYFGLIVTRTDGRPLGLGRAFARELSKVLSGAPLCIGFMLVGMTQEKTGLHDLICGTRVRRRP